MTSLFHIQDLDQSNSGHRDSLFQWPPPSYKDAVSASPPSYAETLDRISSAANQAMHTVFSLRRDIEEGSGRPPVSDAAGGNVTGGVLCGSLAGTFSSPTFEIILIVQVRAL